MPLQQIQLDQSIYRKPQPSPYSQALRPQRVGGGMTAEQRYAPGFVDKEKAQWAAEDKLRKEERDRKVKEAQEMGMRIRDAYQKNIEKAQAQSAEMKANIEAMAMEAYKFATQEGDYGLNEEGRKNILRALKAKPKAYDFLKRKGLIMADGSDFVRRKGEPAEPYEPSWQISEGLMYDKNAPVPTYFEPPELATKGEFDPSKIREFYDAEGNLRVFYGDKALPIVKKEVEAGAELKQKVAVEARQLANQQKTSITTSEENEANYQRNIVALGKAYGLSDEDMEDMSKLTGIKTDQASQLATKLGDAGYTPGMLTQEFKDEFLKNNPDVNAQTLNAAVDMFTKKYVPGTVTPPVGEETEEEKERRLHPKVSKVLGGFTKAASAFLGK